MKQDLVVFLKSYSPTKDVSEIVVSGFKIGNLTLSKAFCVYVLFKTFNTQIF